MRLIARWANWKPFAGNSLGGCHTPSIAKWLEFERSIYWVPS
jgi:hypothetical protein